MATGAAERLEKARERRTELKERQQDLQERLEETRQALGEAVARDSGEDRERKLRSELRELSEEITSNEYGLEVSATDIEALEEEVQRERAAAAERAFEDKMDEATGAVNRLAASLERFLEEEFLELSDVAESASAEAREAEKAACRAMDTRIPSVSAIRDAWTEHGSLQSVVNVLRKWDRGEPIMGQ